MGSSHRFDEAFITSLALSIADQREVSERAEALMAETLQELATVRSLATSETIRATDATLEAEARRATVESLQSEIARLRAQVPCAPAFDPSSVASSSREDPELALLQAELAHMGEMLCLRDKELVILRSTRDQAGPSTSPPPFSIIPPVGLENQEVPFSASEPPQEFYPEPAPQLDPATVETVACLLREHEDLVRERDELRERARASKELRLLGLPKTFDRSLHDTEFELMMERRMTDIRVRSVEQIVEARLRGEMDTTRVRLQAELDASQQEAQRLHDQLARSRESAQGFIQRMVQLGSQVEGSVGVDPRTASG